jgi:tRNA A-37 threonylcarbamoyl transferase component Bud32
MPTKKNMPPVVTGQYLRLAGRNVTVPFKLNIEWNGNLSEVVCDTVLRTLPGKRLVCFGEWEGRQTVIKFFLKKVGAKRHCAREQKGAIALKHAGIKTPSLLFKGIAIPDGIPMLGFQRIAPAENLAEAWEKAETDEQRNKMMEQAASLIANQHEAGLKQDDPHRRNFLLSDGDIYSIDGDAIDVRQMGRPLSKRASLKNLGLFFAQFYPQFDHLITRAFCSYTETRSWPIKSNLNSSLTRTVNRWRKKRQQVYFKKIFRDCSAYVCKKGWHHYMVCDRTFYGNAMDRFFDDPAAAIKSGKLLKDGNSSTVALVKIGDKNLVVKRYNIKNYLHALKRSIRTSRARLSWKNAHRLNLLGILTPKPVAFYEKRFGPLRSTAYFITEFVAGTDVYHLSHSDTEINFDQETLANQFVELIQALVKALVRHGDFKATNFISTSAGLFVTDLDTMRTFKLKFRIRRAFKQDLERFMQNWIDLPETERLFQDKLKKIDLSAI